MCGLNLDYDRYSKWVLRSFRWIREEKDYHLPHHVQMLGIVDAELHGIRKEHLFDKAGKAIEDENGILLLEKYQIKAHLWVLGVYEYVRMLSQRVRKDPALATDTSIMKINETKRLFERLRVPLAKLEASSRNKSTDFEVAYAGIGSKGLGWRISEDTVIYQEELSDAFYEMLCSIKRCT